MCKLYEEAPQLHSQGTHVITTDEMTGIQALERVIMPMEMRHPQKIDDEYVRHGTDVYCGVVAFYLLSI